MNLRSYSTLLLFLLSSFYQCYGQFWTYIPGVNYLLKDYEVCNDEWISPKLDEFRKNLEEKVFGQPLLKEIANSVAAHVNRNPNRALVLSFHGWPGTGKNFASILLAQAIFKRGTQSLFHKYYQARKDFPIPSNADIYKKKLREDISEAITNCPRTMFVFDEVDMMPPKVLDAVVPFIDYHSSSYGIDTRQAMFIFLSNRGGNAIAKLAIDSWRKGIPRSELKISSFQSAILQAAFNEEGGFKGSDSINSHLISYYVPFLPLERQHVIECIEEEFKNRTENAFEGRIKEVLSKVLFTPLDSPTQGMYSAAGCKHIDEYVAALLEGELYRRKRAKLNTRNEF